MEQEIEQYLHQHIPISDAMGVEVIKATADQVILKAPFSKNINHKKTVFGGSLHAVATLACWTWLYVNLKQDAEGQYQIVVAKSEIKYKVPVDTDFLAECLAPDRGVWTRFLHILASKKKAHIRLIATIHHHSRLAVDYHGSFVALSQNSG